MPFADAIPPPEAHGGDAERIAAALGLDASTMIDLSVSLNPFAPDVGRLAVDALGPDLDGVLGRYPSPDAATALVADRLGVDPARLVLTNGGAEAIAWVAVEVGSGHVVEPEFSLYRRHLPVTGPAAPRWRSNPSNPLGQLADASALGDVWDEAFYPLATGRWTRGDDDAWRLGSFTKLWSCPGLRIGYVIAPDAAAADRIRSRLPHWSVSSLALALIPVLLERTELGVWQRQIAELRTTFAERLRQLGVAVRPTDANWVMVEHPDLRARLAPLGVVVRDCTSYAMPGTYRVGLPHPSELERVLAAFSRIVATAT